MRVTQTIAELRDIRSDYRDVIFVPTMGNLHAGHLSLVRRARERPGLVIASIFVNPLQFGPNEDFATYPRTLERDCELLSRGGCDLVFAPNSREMYPDEPSYKVLPSAPLADMLEGAARPGFFTGVCTVVLKLFNIVQPTVVVFGKKDYQQVRVVQSMVRQFALPIEIIEGDTVRHPDGLALSSRNGYLNESERLEAVQLHNALKQIESYVRSGRDDWQQMESTAVKWLRARGWHPDYVAVRERLGLGLPAATGPLVVLGAARLGSTRLIDNLEI